MSVKKVKKCINKFLQDNDAAHLIPEFDKKDVQSKLRKSLTEKDKDAPSRPKTAYFFFCQENRPIVKESLGMKDGKAAPATEVVSVLAKQWRTQYRDNPKMTKKQKAEYQHYNDLAEEAKQKYLVEKKDYDEKKSTMVDTETTKTKKIYKKRPRNAYSFYQSEQHPLVKQELQEKNGTTPTFAEITQTISSEWNIIKHSDKVEKYKKMAEEEKNKILTEEPLPKPTKKSKTSPPKSESPVVEDEHPELEDEDEVKEEVKEEEKPIKVVAKKKKSSESEEVKKPAKNAAFYAFAHQNKEKFIEENPNKKAAEITKGLKEMWKNLSDEEKDEYRKSVQTK